MRPSLFDRLAKYVAVLCLTALCVPGLSQSARVTVEWYEVHNDIAQRLMAPNADYVELARHAITHEPETAREALYRAGLLVRGGLRAEAIDALRSLKALHPQLEAYEIATFYYHACDQLRAWDVARATVELFADNIASLTLSNRLLRHLLETGWTLEQVDQWLADKPAGKNGFWIKERLAFNVEHGRGDALIQRLSADVRAHPEDVEGVILFLDALLASRHGGERSLDLSWMAETVQPTLATQAQKIASRLKTLSQWATAIMFFGQAIDLSLTQEEVQKLGNRSQIALSRDKVLAMFAANIRDDMAACLLELNQNDQAQERMVEAANIREAHGLATNALFAGRTQAASGQRTMERRLTETQEMSREDPGYWQQRARYYRGRSAPAKEEEALLAGLALTTPQPEPTQPTKGHRDWRTALLSDYARFLIREKRTDQAVALLRQELKEAPAASESSKRAAGILAYDLEDQLRVEDPVLWDWLGNRPQWAHPEERLLWRMLESAADVNLDTHFTRAEQAALGKDPTRAHTLGWIMNRMRFPERSIPLLKYAAESTDDEALKARATFTLLESYLDTGNWRHAEAIFSQAAGRLTAGELPDWYSRVAVAAAKAGDTADAMRVWQRVWHLCPADLKGLDALASAGLRKELRVFYHEMSRTFPTSTVPARAAAILTRQPPRSQRQVDLPALKNRRPNSAGRGR